MPLHRSGIILIISLGFAAFALVNCSPQTGVVPLSIDSTTAFSYSGNQEMNDRWWRVFDDPQLNNLVDSALRSNYDLETTWQRLREAQAVVDRQEAGLFPFIDVFLQSELSGPRSEFEEFERENRLQAGLAAEYEVDLWGRIGAAVRAQRYRADAAYVDYQTAALSLSAEIVRTWFQLMEANSQLELLAEQIETNEQVLVLIRARFGSGQTRSVDILRQRQLLEASREQKINVESRAAVLEHRLAVLLGRSPQQAYDYAAQPLPDAPPLPETGLPADLIRRRPDVKSAFNLLQAADREVASAVSAQYPRLTLSATVSTAGYQPDDLLEGWARTLAGNLLAPVFYGGELRAEVDRTEAVKRQRLYEYGQTILTAFREVEDALIQERKQIEAIQSIEEQVELIRQTYEQLRIEYLNGMSDYLDVLTALDQEQQLRRDLISGKLLLLEYRIALYRALAGGFERETVN